MNKLNFICLIVLGMICPLVMALSIDRVSYIDYYKINNFREVSSKELKESKYRLTLCVYQGAEVRIKVQDYSKNGRFDIRKKFSDVDTLIEKSSEYFLRRNSVDRINKDHINISSDKINIKIKKDNENYSRIDFDIQFNLAIYLYKFKSSKEGWLTFRNVNLQGNQILKIETGKEKFEFTYEDTFSDGDVRLVVSLEEIEAK